MSLSRDELLHRISEAFADVSPPPADRIAEEHDWDAECINAELSRYFTTPPPCELIQEHAASISALTPRAFHFFLKDYLRWAVEDCWSAAGQHTIFTLSDASLSATYWQHVLRKFSTAQRHVIVEFAEFVVGTTGDLGTLSDHAERIREFWSSDWDLDERDEK
jgi:hypothetical protein